MECKYRLSISLSQSLPNTSLRANFYGADLTGADLTGVDLTGANLREAYLTGAYLTGAYLTGANLTRAYLTGANLTGVDLRGAKGLTYEQLASVKSLFGAKELATALKPEELTRLKAEMPELFEPPKEEQNDKISS